jgi:two-component system, chemotaxis family, CheB/CheR fusion protein
MMNALFESIVRTVRQPLLVLDESLCVLLATDAFYTTFMVTEQDVQGRSLFELGDGQWDIPALRKLIQDVIPQHSSFDDFEVDHVFPGLGRRIMLLNGREIVGLPEGRCRILLAIEDITLRKMAELESQRLMDELKRANTDLHEFAHVASHDLQEPLRKIQAFGDRLAARAGSLLDPESRMYLERMLNATERMQTLIEDLLQYARLDRRPDARSFTNLSTVVVGVLQDLDASIQQTGARVSVAGDLGCIPADPMRMRQMMQNLISNAIKFSRPGYPPEILIDSRLITNGQISDNQDTVVMREITVRDNGIGFEEKYLDRIFGMFQRLNPRHAYTGTGVGLAVCRKIAEQHGGRITAHSQPGEGSTFIVTLPVQQRKADPC